MKVNGSCQVRSPLVRAVGQSETGSRGTECDNPLRGFMMEVPRGNVLENGWKGVVGYETSFWMGVGLSVVTS